MKTTSFRRSLFAALIPMLVACTVEPVEDEGDGDSEIGVSSSILGDTPGVVGTWWSKSDGIEVAWTLCADGRMVGTCDIGDRSYMDKGSWSGSSEVAISWRSKDTANGDEYATDTASLSFDPAEDTLCCNDGTAMTRVDVDVTNADCDPEW